MPYKSDAQRKAVHANKFQHRSTHIPFFNPKTKETEYIHQKHTDLRKFKNGKHASHAVSPKTKTHMFHIHG